MHAMLISADQQISKAFERLFVWISFATITSSNLLNKLSNEIVTNKVSINARNFLAVSRFCRSESIRLMVRICWHIVV